MSKLLKVIFFIVILITLAIGAFMINSMNYKKVAENRIGKVIEFQGADMKNATIKEAGYDYFSKSYSKKIYFENDPSIEYRYNFEKGRNRVHVTAYSGNASLDLLDKKAKYDHFIKVYFNTSGEISSIEK